MQVYAKLTSIILQHEPRNLKRDISSNNAKHHKQEASILISTSVLQIILITPEQSPEDFSFGIIEISLSECMLFGS